MRDEPYTEAQREYREVYLRSEHWRKVRKDALERAGHRCQVCNSAKRLDAHHRTYENKGAEKPGDVTVLCRSCHEKFHDEGKVKPKWGKKPKRRTLNRDERRQTPFQHKRKPKVAPVTVISADGSRKTVRQWDIERGPDGKKKKRMAEPQHPQPWETRALNGGTE